jgi:hypothetical protein
VYQLRSLFNVLPYSIFIRWRKVIPFGWVNIPTKIADPLLAKFSELNKGIDVGSTILASNNGFVIKACALNRFPTWQFPKWFYNYGEWYA